MASEHRPLHCRLRITVGANARHQLLCSQRTYTGRSRRVSVPTGVRTSCTGLMLPQLVRHTRAIMFNFSSATLTPLFECASTEPFYEQVRYLTDPGYPHSTYLQSASTGATNLTLW
ncbi:hypothetical protein PsYK624_047090 [Phanerochaete sordida]|uniref:Uncharacterized protein n=1 Tax=Phanerochaete sordida TaxID=48140 RepID=A0A9P3G5G5_9APHY|nr:hypothetical protein PsYK624_047090 [Phanerochaete sordida]